MESTYLPLHPNMWRNSKIGSHRLLLPIGCRKMRLPIQLLWVQEN